MAENRSGGKSLPTLVGELWDLTVSYLKQETVVPIKSLGRFVAWGMAGAILLTTSFVVLLVAALRALQAETGDTFTGTWSFLPYFIVLAVAGSVAALAASRIGAASKKR